MRAKIENFAMRNYTWISTIGRAILKRCKLSPEEYIKNLVNATIPFDELAIVITCRVYNIHCIVLLHEGYWTTCPNLMFHDCLLWLAYVGDFGFKEISTELIKQLSEPEPDSDALHQDISSEQEDLAGTGLLDNEEYDTNNNDATPAEESNEHDNNNDVDIKPPVLAKFCFASDTIVIDTDLDTGDVTNDNNTHDDDTDVIFDRYGPPKNSWTQHQCRYDCYVYSETFEMQQSFVVHFQSTDPTDPFKCAFCSGDFQSPNGLFKHERSHKYMKYLCIVCGKRFQFPYQLTNHPTVHTGLGRHKYDSYDKTFGSKCSHDFHQKTHGVELQCDLCPINSAKTFSNDVALRQHQRGVCGPGWTMPCGENKK